MTTSAVYLRISKDKALGTEAEGHAVDRQRKDIHKLLKAKGWEIGTEYLENDTSASGKVPRPEYQRMLADYAAGEFDAISAWKLDRLWRVPKELEHIIELVESTALMVATVDGSIDLTTSQGRTMARVLTAFAQDELDKRSDRQKARFAQDREAGHNHWRGRRPFGLTLEGKEVPEEAQAIRDIAALLLDGGNISKGVRLLNERGILTTFGGPWERTPLRRTMLNPRLAGLREHEGDLIEGKWDAVLDEELWRAVGAVLTTPGRGYTRLNEREYLLSGLLTCEVCGAKCYGTRARKKDTKRVETYIYRCSAGASHVSRVMAQTDHLVMAMTVQVLEAEGTEEAEADEAALKALREARAVEIKYWSDWVQEAEEERMRPSEYRRPRELHEQRLGDIDTRLNELQRISLVRLPTAEESEEGITKVYEWSELSLEKRRRIIETLWESITLIRTSKGTRWNPENVVLKRRERRVIG